MQRVTTTKIRQHIGQRVRVQGWLHALRKLGGVTFVVVRDGWGTVQAVSEDEAELARVAGGRPGRGDGAGRGGHGGGRSPGAWRRRAAPVGGGGADAGDRDAAATPQQAPDQGQPAHAAGPRRRRQPPSGPACGLPAGRRRHGRLSGHAERARLHRDPDAQDRRLSHRERQQRLPARLLRPAGLPGAEPPVLQADHGRRLRARLRGRAGLPRRAARHHPPRQRVRQPGRGVRLHREPLHGDGAGARRDRRYPGDAARPATRPSWPCWRRACRPCPP